ncbi:hypothetical protein V8G54_012335 [Vigna mungo]|uniref:Uncharacterized protein n=1 Tax=Vigna mungo TaxID=3915 RepID=A0AAQ3S0H5_VIGMU
MCFSGASNPHEGSATKNGKIYALMKCVVCLASQRSCTHILVSASTVTLWVNLDMTRKDKLINGFSRSRGSQISRDDYVEAPKVCGEGKQVIRFLNIGWGLWTNQVGMSSKGILFFDRMSEDVLDSIRGQLQYRIMVGQNLISGKSKNKILVSRTCAKAEYKKMEVATGELIWLKQSAVLDIVSNAMFYDRTKDIQLDYHFIREKIKIGDITTRFVNCSNQWYDVFTNP